MRILLIDPDPGTSKELTRVLSGWGATISHAVSATMAVDMAKNQTFDFALMELCLGASMGYEIIPDLKRYNSEIRIITMTQGSTPELERKTREYGIVFYMEKPVPKNQLKQILSQISKKNNTGDLSDV